MYQVMRYISWNLLTMTGWVSYPKRAGPDGVTTDVTVLRENQRLVSDVADCVRPQAGQRLNGAGAGTPDWEEKTCLE
jgi:hypothetical protein